MIFEGDERTAQLDGVTQPVRECLVDVYQRADIKAFDAEIGYDLAADTETIAARNLLLHVVPKDEVLEVRVVLVLVEALARAFTDGAECLFTKTSDLVH